MQEATAAGIRMINEAKPSEAVLTIKSLEAFEKVADGQATKIIIPSDIQNMAGLIAGIKEVATDTPAAKSVASAPQKNTAKYLLIKYSTKTDTQYLFR